MVENVIWQELVKCLLPLSFQKEKKRSARSHVNYISLDQLLKTELFLNKWKVLHAIFINYRKFFKIKLWKMHGNSHFIKFHDFILFSLFLFRFYKFLVLPIKFGLVLSSFQQLIYVKGSQSQNIKYKQI